MRQTLIALSLLVTLVSLDAQGVTYEPGDSVKVTAPSLWKSERPGTIVRLGGDSLTFLDAYEDARPVTIPSASVTHFELKRGNAEPESHAGKGALIGAIGGAFLGGIIAGSTNQLPACQTQQLCFNDMSNGMRAAGGVAVGAIGGALIGVLIGASVGRGSAYRSVDLSQIGGIGALIHESDLAFRPTWDPSRRAPGVALSARF